MTLTGSLGYSNTEELLRMGPSQLSSTSGFFFLYEGTLKSQGTGDEQATLGFDVPRALTNPPSAATRRGN